MKEEQVTDLDRYERYAENVARLSVAAYEAYRNHVDLDYYDEPEKIKRYAAWRVARQEFQEALAEMHLTFPGSKF